MRNQLINILVTLTLSMLLVACGTVTQPEVTTTEEIETTIESVESEEVITETTLEEAESTEAVQEETTEAVLTEELTSEEAETVTYTYTDMDATMYAQRSVNVRDLPSTDGNKLGGLNTNDEVKVTGQCNETKWYRFEYKDQTAYVSNSYLGENKVEVSETLAASSKKGSSSVTRNIADYRSISSLLELTVYPEWDYSGWWDAHKTIEKVTYSYNGTTVLLYNITWYDDWGAWVILYDFNNGNMPWCRLPAQDLTNWINAGGDSYISGGEQKWKPISDFQVY